MKLHSGTREWDACYGERLQHAWVEQNANRGLASRASSQQGAAGHASSMPVRLHGPVINGVSEHAGRKQQHVFGLFGCRFGSEHGVEVANETSGVSCQAGTAQGRTHQTCKNLHFFSSLWVSSCFMYRAQGFHTACKTL